MHEAISANSLQAIPGLCPSWTLAVPPRAGSLQLSPGLEEPLIPPPPIRLFTVQLNLFRAKFSSLGKGKPGAAALWQNIIVSASYFSLHFCRALLLQKKGG